MRQLAYSARALPRTGGWSPHPARKTTTSPPCRRRVCSTRSPPDDRELGRGPDPSRRRAERGAGGVGRSLFFDKVLSGNRDVSCATCHSPEARTADGLSLAVGTGALVNGTARTLGPGRQFTPRNAPSLFSGGLRPVYIFWDGRVSEEGFNGIFTTPAGTALPGGLSSILAAQAMIPVTNRAEMRGVAGDHDVFGARRTNWRPSATTTSRASGARR